jgi:hypothetical protein
MNNKSEERKRKKDKKRKHDIQEKKLKAKDTQINVEEKKFGKVQLGVMLFLVVAALGFIILKVK